MADSFQSLRALSVRAGDALTVLMAYGPRGFPTEEGVTLDAYVGRVLTLLAQLAARTSVTWKKRLLELAGLEVQQAHDAYLRLGDEERAWQLLRDASDHFRDFERGEPPGTGTS